MSQINVLQNEETNLQLLKAYSVKYTKAKKVRNIRIRISILFALLTPIIIFLFEQQRTLYSICGGCWAVIALLLSFWEKNLIATAVKIHEEFDINVFNIKWNQLLAGDPEEKETILTLASKYQTDSKIKLTNWYGDLLDIPELLDALICQRSNVIWDIRLRQNYFTLSLFFTIVIFAVGLGLSLHYNFSLYQYIIQVFIPSSSAYLLGCKELKEHYDNFSAKKKLLKKVNQLINDTIDTIDTNQVLNKNILRQVQDQIFLLRKCPALVPNWYNKLFRKKYETNMQWVIKNFQEQINTKTQKAKIQKSEI